MSPEPPDPVVPDLIVHLPSAPSDPVTAVLVAGLTMRPGTRVSVATTAPPARKVSLVAGFLVWVYWHLDWWLSRRFLVAPFGHPTRGPACPLVPPAESAPAGVTRGGTEAGVLHLELGARAEGVREGDRVFRASVDGQELGSGPLPLVACLARGSPVSVLELHRSPAGPYGESLVYRCELALHAFSLRRGFQSIAEKLLRALHREGGGAPEAVDRLYLSDLFPAKPGGSSPWTLPAEAPALAVVVRLWMALAATVCARLLERWSRPRWWIATRESPGLGMAPGQHTLLGPEELEFLEPDPGSFLADPHLLAVAGRPYLLCEELLDRTGRGRILAFPLDRERLEDPAVALDPPWHLSYPAPVLDGEGRTLVVPESSETRTTHAYLAAPPPAEWRSETEILPGVRAADMTFLRRDGRLWVFFVTSGPGVEMVDELYAYHAPDLRGPWTPHAGNPIVRSGRSARPAGPFLDWHGRLIRPAQDCAGRYGRAVRFFEVLALGPREYREQEIGSLQPEPGSPVLGTHTVCAGHGLLAVDMEVCTRSAHHRGPWLRLEGLEILPVSSSDPRG